MTNDSNETMTARERILCTAEEILFKDGFAGASVRELTEAAGVNVALVNYYFGSKRNLYLEVLRQKFSAAAQKKCAILKTNLSRHKNPTLRTVLKGYVDLYLGSDESMRATQNFHHLIARQLAEDDDAMELLLNELVMPIHQTLKGAINQLFPKMETDKLSLCIGSLTGQIFHFLRFPRAYSALLSIPEGTELRESVADHIVNFSLNGMTEEFICASHP